MKGVKLVLMPKLGAPANYFMSDVYEMPIIVLSDHVRDFYLHPLVSYVH